MKIGDRFVMRGNENRHITISGIGGTSVYYFFDGNPVEKSLPTGKFGWWFVPTEYSKQKVDLCDCGGYTTYNSYDDLYHSSWCKTRKGCL